MITVVCYLPLSNLIQPLITWYNPFGDTLASPTLCVHPFLSLILATFYKEMAFSKYSKTWPTCLHPPDGHWHHFSTSCPAVGCWPPSVCGEAAAIFTISSLTTQLDTNISTVIPKYKKSWKYATYEGCLKITRLGSWIINRASHVACCGLHLNLQIIKPGF